MPEALEGAWYCTNLVISASIALMKHEAVWSTLFADAIAVVRRL